MKYQPSTGPSTWRRFLWERRGWLFPGLVISLLIGLSVMQLSGSSVGVYDSFFGRSTPDLVNGQPRTVRSDEWMVTTPLTAAQQAEQFPTTNQDIGEGQDMSLVVDVPYADWSSLFKPQNWAFFWLPLDMAFAFKWWSLAALLLLAVYSFVLFFAPQRYLLAALISLAFLFSPFIQWWYQSITVLPIAYGLLMWLAAMRLIQTPQSRPGIAIVWALGLGYLAACFALLMYPAFQITVALCLVAVAVAYLQSQRLWSTLFRRRNLLLLGLALLLAGGITALFLVQHLDAVKATLGTVYPGSRQVSSGGLSIYSVLTWPLDYLLLDNQQAAVFDSNQSEASGFLLIGFVLMPYLVWLLGRRTASSTDDQPSWMRPLLFTSCLLAGLFLARMFVPFGDPLYSLLGLSKVPHIRLLIGLGLLNLIFVIIALLRPHRPLTNWRQLFSWRQLAVVASVGAIYAGLVWLVVQQFHPSTVGTREILFLIAVLTACTAPLLSPFMPVRLVGLLVLVSYSLLSAATVHPLYRGLNLHQTAFAQYIQQTEPADDGYWAANDSPILSALLVANGAETRGGVNTYPQRDLWQQHFPDHQNVTNRYAHVRFQFDDAQTKPRVELIQSDSFYVRVAACDPLVRQLAIDHIVSDRPLTAPCFSRQEQRQFDQKTLYLYHR